MPRTWAQVHVIQLSGISKLPPQDHCEPGSARQCPEDKPTCAGYVENEKMGECIGSAGDICEAVFGPWPYTK
eukprot:SAG31_NODE_11697_length_1005_cov_2.133554_2_plen_72_part_00